LGATGASHAFRATVDHVAVVRVLVSDDRRWRVEIRDDGTCRVLQDGFRVATVRRFELAETLAGFGLDIADLTED
ncbi:MAG TPA: hypothetical protein VGW74_05060, partial [Propionibacteriaceae bacterium]|nr:hypothetical protein [Propionibacteriaceae bacterium]